MILGKDILNRKIFDYEYLKKFKDAEAHNKEDLFIVKTIELESDKYIDFTKNLREDHDFLKETANINEKYNKNVCVFIKPKDHEYGIIGNTEGSLYLKYLAYIDNIDSFMNNALDPVHEKNSIFKMTLHSNINDCTMKSFEPTSDHYSLNFNRILGTSSSNSIEILNIESDYFSRFSLKKLTNERQIYEIGELAIKLKQLSEEAFETFEKELTYDKNPDIYFLIIEADSYIDREAQKDFLKNILEKEDTNEFTKNFLLERNDFIFDSLARSVYQSPMLTKQINEDNLFEICNCVLTQFVLTKEKSKGMNMDF